MTLFYNYLLLFQKHHSAVVEAAHHPDQPVESPKCLVIEDAAGNLIGLVKETIIVNAEGEHIDTEGQLPPEFLNFIKSRPWKLRRAACQRWRLHQHSAVHKYASIALEPPLVAVSHGYNHSYYT